MDAVKLSAKLRESAAFLRAELGEAPECVLVLGSGLGALAERLEGARSVAYAAIPHFPVPTVSGHSGRLLVGRLGGRSVACMQGRIHYYEGQGMEAVVYPMRVFVAWGVRSAILTNAAGGCGADMHPGELMLISDHINFLGTNPLIGPNLDEYGERFRDMTQAYDAGLRAVARAVAARQGLRLHEGVYMAFTGPSFETPAEIRMAQALGASAVGMSTVPETIVARHGGLRVLGISCITNYAAGLASGDLSHLDVMAVGERVKQGFMDLIEHILADAGFAEGETGV